MTKIKYGLLVISILSIFTLTRCTESSPAITETTTNETTAEETTADETTTEEENTEQETTTEEQKTETYTYKTVYASSANSKKSVKQNTSSYKTASKKVTQKKEETTVQENKTTESDATKAEEKTEETTKKAKEEETTKAKSTSSKKKSSSKKSTKKNYTDNDLYCLAAVIYNEAGCCSDHVQKMVATVVMNRVASKMYPNNIYAVLTQKYQYGMMWKYGVSFPKGASQKLIDRCYKNAKIILEGHRECPSNVLGQAEFPSLHGVYEYTEGIYFSYY